MARLGQGARDHESGQAAVQYALLIAIVAIGLAVVLILFGSSVARTYDRVANRVGNAEHSGGASVFPPAYRGGGGGGGGLGGGSSGGATGDSTDTGSTGCSGGAGEAGQGGGGNCAGGGGP